MEKRKTKKLQSIPHFSIRAILVAVVFVMLLGLLFCFMSYRTSVDRSEKTVKIGVDDVYTSMETQLHMYFGGLAWSYANRFQDIDRTDPDAWQNMMDTIREEDAAWDLNYEMYIIDDKGIILASFDREAVGKDVSGEKQVTDFRNHEERLRADEKKDWKNEDYGFFEEPRPSLLNPEDTRVYIDYPLESGNGFLRLGVSAEKYNQAVQSSLYGEVTYRSLGNTGHMLVADRSGTVISSFMEEYNTKPLQEIWPDCDTQGTVDIEWEKAVLAGEDVRISVRVFEGCRVLGYMLQSEVSEAAWSSVLALLVNLLVMAALLILILVVFFRKRLIEQEAARIDEELAFAKRIQMSAMPKHLPEGEAFLVHADMRTAKEVGGDFYNVFMTGETLVFLIADVSGKGIPAALFMMEAKAIIEEQVAQGLTPGEVFTNTNMSLCMKNEAEMFLTAWIGFLDIKSGKLTIANAGHNPFVYIHGEDVNLAERKSGLILGMMDDFIYEEEEMQLSPGDIIYLYTDGVTEARGESELYGEERMLEVLKNTHTREGSDLPTALCGAVNRDVDEYTAGDEQTDDITMVCVQYTGHSVS